MKKRIYSLLVLLGAVQGLTAQLISFSSVEQMRGDSDPIAIDGKEWNVRAGHYIYFSDIRMWIDGDTIVDGMACKRLYTHTKQLWEEGKESVEVGYCRQDGDKYYQNGELMFDFSLQKGDKFTLNGYATYSVIDTGYIVLKDGVSRRCLTVMDDNTESSPDEYNSDVWVEGVGSLRMGVFSNDFVSAGLIKTLLGCSYNGQHIYYHDPIAIDGKEWYIREKIVHYIDYSSDVHMWIAGDTIVDDIYCKKLYIHTKQLWEGGEESLEVRYCHQDGEKYYQNGDLMYDFSLEVGDEFATYVDNEENKLLYTVVGVGDTVLLDGLSRKYLVMAPSYEGVVRSEETDIWVEGIGSLTQGIALNDFYWSEGVITELQSCSYNGQCIYEKVQAQPYLVTEGKQWAVERYTMGGVQGVYSYCLQGDTIINGKEYKIEHEGCGKDLSGMKPSGRYMREENGRVYSYVHTERYKDEDEVLFFDFNLEDGDTIVYIPDVYSLHVMDVYDAVVHHSDGQSRKCYEVELWNIREEGVYDSDDFGGTFVEGIGNLCSGLSDPGFGLVGSNQRLLYVKQGDTILYQREEENPKEQSKFFADDTKWYGSEIEYRWGRPSSYYGLTYHIGADTLTDRGFGQNLYRNDEYWGTFITNGEQVWLYPGEALFKEFYAESREPFLLYDFSLQPNDTLYFTWNTLGFSREIPEDEYFERMVVKNVYHTSGRKVIVFDEGYRWAEGIGNLGEPILNLWRPMTTNGDGWRESIDRVEANGQVIYSNGEFVNPNIESWLKAGMEWTENKQYTKDGDIVTRKVTISEGDTPGFYKVSSNDSKHKLPFTRLQVTNNKVYGHGLGDVFLLYDFSLKVGDKIFLLKYYCYGIDKYTYEYDQCYVTKVDTVVYNGVPRKRIILSGDREDVWVEGIGSLTRVFPIDGVIDYEYYSENAFFSEVVECTYNGETLYHKSFISDVKKGYGIYHGDSYLYRYTIDESKEVTDSTDFARWYDKTVIYFDVDTIGPNAFSGATFRQGQILYFTERLNTIFKDAFTDINIIKRTSQESLMSDDLTLVFAGANPPGIDKNHIMDYADSTYHINYVVPDLKTYIKDDIQWAYTTLMTIDDFVQGYVSPENEVTVNDSTETDVNLQPDTNQNGNIDLVVHARPRKEIPVRIGEGENKDIYSRAPAWMRYTMELRITDTEGTELYAGKMQCSAYGECQFNASFACPADNIIHIYSRSIDMFGRATEWAVTTINLDTSIDPIVTPNTDAPYYDLQGRPVAHPTRGIYIKNGRKVVL